MTRKTRANETDPQFIWLSRSETAEELRVSVRTVARLIDAGELRAVSRVTLQGVPGRRNAIPLSEIREYQRRQLQGR